MAATGAFAVVPSGMVTLTVEPGSPTPETVSVPLAFGVVVRVGAAGAVVSVKAALAGGEELPAASLATAVTAPDVGGVALVAL